MTKYYRVDSPEQLLALAEYQPKTEAAHSIENVARVWRAENARRAKNQDPTPVPMHVRVRVESCCQHWPNATVERGGVNGIPVTQVGRIVWNRAARYCKSVLKPDDTEA